MQSAETGFTSRVTESQRFIESIEPIELTNVRTRGITIRVKKGSE